jgi:arylsulfatase A-like enzyme
VIVVSLDTLRADHLGAYGYDKPTSPFIDALAEESWLFEDCTSASSWTTASHASLFSGVHSSMHPRVDQSRYRIPEAMVMLAELYQREGYLTQAYTEGLLVGGDFGFAQGFDNYSDGPRQHPAPPGTAAQTFNAAEKWLDEFGHLPHFLFVHTYEIHAPYSPPEPFSSEWRTSGKRTVLPTAAFATPKLRSEAIALYDGGIAYTDSELGNFIGALRTAGRLNNTLLIVLSDHGEEFWEHDGVEHGTALFRESVHVPLIIRFPGVAPTSGRVSTPVSLNDVFATVLDISGIASSTGRDSYSLMPLIDGAAAEYARPMVTATLRMINRRYLYVSGQEGAMRYMAGTSFNNPGSPLLDYDALFEAGTPIESTFMRRVADDPPVRRPRVRNESWNLLDTGYREFLFDHTTDAEEHSNLLEAEAPVAAKLRDDLADYLNAMAEAGTSGPAVDEPLTEEEQAELEAMGYID